jgi:hypothetical protein
MSQWIERIQGHAVFKELTDLEQSLESSREAAQADSAAFDAWERIERVTKFIRTFLSDVDPQLVPPSHLSNAHSQLQQVRNQLNSFTGSRNVGHLNEANNQLDNVLSQLGSIPRLEKASSTQELGEAASSYKKSIGGLVRSLEKQLAAVVTEKDVLQTKLQELTAEVAAQKQRADNVITQMQQQFSAAQEARQSEAATSETKRSTEFEAAEEERAQESEQALVTHQKDFSDFLTASKVQHDALREDLSTQSKSLIAALETQKAYAEKVVGIISTEAVAHGYGKTANEERDAAKGWRIVAVIALIVWIVAGLVFFALTYDKDLSLSALARQFLISTPFVLLAGFAALQVSKHQRAERINRQQELEIAAIDPYLATFDVDTRNEVKRTLAEKLFGQRDADPQKGDSKQMLEAVSDTLKTVKQLQESLTKK